MEIIEIKGRRYVQAVQKVESGFVPVYGIDGKAVYALPGGGRATEEEIKNG